MLSNYAKYDDADVVYFVEFERNMIKSLEAHLRSNCVIQVYPINMYKEK